MTSTAVRPSKSPGMRRTRAGGPDPLNAILLNLAGLALVFGAWLAVSGQAALRDQITPLNVAVAGAVLAGTGNALYLLQFRKLVKVRIRPRLEAGEETA